MPFDSDQAALDQDEVHDALQRAEEIVGDRFAVPSFDDPRYAFDVLPLGQLEPDEVPTPPALAQLVRYGRGPGERGLHRFHRICLNDARILDCCAREGIPLAAVLLVVLTHELIHLVRFTTPETAFHAPSSERRAEEVEVDRLTQDVLADYPDVDVRRAVEVVTAQQ